MLFPVLQTHPADAAFLHQNLRYRRIEEDLRARVARGEPQGPRD